MPFCVLIGAMSCYLNLSRRLELVVARAAGMSAWQFIAPALIVALLLGVVRDHGLQSDRRRSCRSARNVSRPRCSGAAQPACRRRQRLLAAPAQRRRPVRSSMPRRAASRACSSAASRVFTFDASGQLPGAHRGQDRDPAGRATGGSGTPDLSGRRTARRPAHPTSLKTNLTPEQVRESFCDPRNCVVLATAAVYRDGRSMPD